MVKGKMKRLISMLLAFALMSSIFSVNVKADSINETESIVEPKDNVFVQMNGEDINSVSMKTDEKLTLTAYTTIKSEVGYAWEILVDADTNKWTYIYDCEDINIVVSYGMLSNFLDENNLAQIRAVVLSDEDIYVSDSVLIEVKQNVEYNNKKDVMKSFKATSNYSLKNTDVNTGDVNLETDNNDELVTLTINYLRETGEQICDPYIATIYKGMHFKTTVLSPVVAGYEPKFNESDTELVEEYVFNFDKVNEDVVINVIYYPVEVRYEVRYYMQNVYDDDYTMMGTPTVAYGKVGTAPDESLVNAKFDGFVRVNYQPELIASDGSTVFQCFYDREYYLVNLELDDGYGVDSVYAKYDTVFVVNNPQKAGYIFTGWDVDNDGVADGMVGSIPSENITYRALWDTTDTSYTVAYWLNTQNGNNFIGSRVLYTESASVVSGTGDLGDSSICGVEEHQHSDLSGCYDCKEDACTHGKISCYTTSTGYKKASDLTNNTQKTVYNNLVNKVGTGTEGYVYKYRNSNSYYNFFYIGGTWYYLGTSSSYCNIRLNGNLSNPSRNNFTSISAVLNCSNTCTHTELCLICSKEEHTHGENGMVCEIDETKYEYLSDLTDKNIIVKGDGSTVVNVYYKYKEYTLKFYYAKEEDGKYYICGNTTQFANGDGITNQLENVDSYWGEVKELPTLSSTDNIDISIYELGYDEYTINGKTGKYYYLQFTEEYDADISNKWPVGIFNRVETASTFDYGDYAYFSAWNVDSNSWYDNQYSNKTLKGNYQRLDYKMLMDNNFNQTTINFLGFWENGTTGLGWNKPHKWNYNVYIPILDDTTEYDKEYEGVKYKLYGSYVVYDNNTSTLNTQYCDQTPTALEGFTISHYDAYKIETYDTTYNLEIHQIDFYYTRNSNYTLNFYNHGKLEDEKTQSNIYFETNLSGSNYAPSYPSTLESNAYEFDGWYTTAGCYEGTKVDFDNLKMPASNLALYSKWVPVTHTVTFYNTYQAMASGVSPLSTVEVPHGAILESKDVPDAYNEGYLAGEWFYIKNGEKVAYRPISIPIKTDISVYRDWSSNTVVEYTVHYYKNGTTEKVADDSTGWMFNGATKTFKAKGGGENGELYDAYKNGWYPNVSSTSIVADREGNNIVTFYYDYQNPNPYTVKYIDSETGLEIANSKVVTGNEKSVVTEVYKPIDGYISDAYYKQLVLALNKENDADKNIITFYYSKSSNSAYYAVEYYFMNADGSTYKLNAKIQSPISIGSKASIPEVTEEGYLFEKCLVKKGNEEEFKQITEGEMSDITIDENGALIQVYYEREKTSYTVHYYLSGTETSIKEGKTVDGIYFGTSITEEADISLQGYSLIGDSSQTKELVLDSSYNVFTFYYDETLKTAKYKAVCSDDRFKDKGFGFVSHTLDIKKWTQDYNEVTATARDGFYFAGWYSDESLTTLVSTDATILPESNEDITYYALFEPYLTDLVISKSVDSLIANQTFVFNIKGLDKANEDVDITVTIHGDDEIKVCSLLIGNYRVTEDVEWSWKYNSVDKASKDVNLVVDKNQNRIEFTNNLGNSNWLSGEDYSVNIFD